MHAGKAAAGAVVVHHQIVRAQHAVIAQHLFGDVVGQLLAGGLAEDGVQRLLDELRAADEDEQRTARPIQPSSCQCVSAETASETSTAAVLITSLRLSAAVASSAAESIFLPSVRLNEASHSFTAMDSANTAAVTGLSAVSCGCRIFSDAAFGQLQPDDEDHHRHRQPRDVLDARVAVGCSRSAGFSARAEAHQRHHAGRRVRQVVHGVGRDGHAAGHRCRWPASPAHKSALHTMPTAPERLPYAARTRASFVSALFFHKAPDEKFRQTKTPLACAALCFLRGVRV